MIDELAGHSVRDLLRLQASAIEELRRRGIVRSRNNPIADCAEHLFCRAFGWSLAPKVEKDADAIGTDGTRYQIKSRRPTHENPSRQLGWMRRLPEKNFDVLAAVLFTEDFGIYKAALVPHSVVLQRARYVDSVKGWRLLLRDDVWAERGVEDATEAIRRAADSL